VVSAALNTKQVGVSSGKIPGTMQIDQDAAIYLSSLAAGQQVTHTFASALPRNAYVFVMDGEVEVNGVALAAGDQGRIADESQLVIAAKQPSNLILLDLP